MVDEPQRGAVSKNVPALPRGHDLLRGRRVLVTASAGSGIGYATARRCLEEGADVMLSDIHRGRLEQTAERLSDAFGRRVPAVVCDVRSGAQVSTLVDEAEARLGGIDLLVNNAGLGLTRHLVEMEDADFTNLIDLNLGGTFRMMRAALPSMQARRTGSIINLSSIVAWRAEAGQTAYAASKAGILALTRCAAMEAAEFGVRVNAVVPSLALNPHLEKVSSAAFLAEMIERNEAFGRAAEPEEIANAIVFLGSDYASYLTGEALSVSCRRS